MQSAKIQEFAKISVGRAALIGALAGAGKWGHDLPKQKGQGLKKKLQTLALDVGGGAAIGGSLGAGARHGARALRKHIGRGVSEGVAAGSKKNLEEFRRTSRWPLRWLLRK